MSKLLLTFLLSPTIFSSALSLLLSINVANATEPVPVTSVECQRTSYTRPLSCQRVSQSSSDSKFITIQTAELAQQSDETPMLEFTKK